MGLALMLVEMDSQARRADADAGLRGELALVVALDNEVYVRRQVGDTDGAAAAGTEPLERCGRLADREDGAWAGIPEALRAFARA